MRWVRGPGGRASRTGGAATEVDAGIWLTAQPRQDQLQVVGRAQLGVAPGVPQARPDDRTGQRVTQLGEVVLDGGLRIGVETHLDVAEVAIVEQHQGGLGDAFQHLDRRPLASQVDLDRIAQHIARGQEGEASSQRFVGLAAYNITNADPLKADDAPLSLEDAAFELDVLQDRADRGRLTPEAFAQSGIAQRLDTAQIMTINESIRAGDFSFIGALKSRIEQAQQPAQTPATQGQ